MSLLGWNFAVVGPGWQKFDLAFAREALKYAEAHGGTAIYSFHSGEYLMRDGKLTDYGRYVLEDGPLPDRLRSTQRLRSPSSHARGRGKTSLRVDLPLLQKAMRGRKELLEALEAGSLKASGRPGANVGQMWALAQRALYSSADVPTLCIRECFQNAADSIRAAVASHQLKRGEGRFDVLWDDEARTLRVLDNGRGMDSDTILNKFLVLGASDKGDASSSEEAAGGFGIAKAVILGASSSYAKRDIMHCTA